MNFKENIPIYMQIAERICDEIMEGKYSSAGRIPSVREYSVLVDVNTNTVMRSFDLLQTRGIISMKRGVGYFVEPAAADKIKKSRQEVFVSEELPYFYSRMKSLGISISELEQILLKMEIE